jgi:glycine/serine hydroxymethyltransferase
MTTQGMKEPEAAEVASLIARALQNRADPSALSEVAGRVSELAASFSPYPHEFSGHV